MHEVGLAVTDGLGRFRHVAERVADDPGELPSFILSRRRNLCVPLMFLGQGERMRIFKKNPNRQDTLLGGLILSGFVVIAVIAALSILFSWRVEQTADAPKTVGSSPHSSTSLLPTAPSAK